MHFSHGSAHSSDVGRFRKCFVSFSALRIHNVFFSDAWNGNMILLLDKQLFKFIIEILFWGLTWELHTHLNTTVPIILSGEVRVIKKKKRAKGEFN